MAQDAVPQPPNTLGNITDLVSKLAPLFLGTGKSTTTSTGTSTASPGALAANQQLFNTASGNAANPSATDATVQNILNKSAIDFAPVVGQQNAAGMYNTSTLSMLSAQAQGQAVAQSAQAVLQYQTQQEQIASQANSAALSATKTTSTTGTTQTAPVVNSTLSLLSSVGGLGLSAAKLLFPTQTKAIGDAASSAVNSGISSIKNLFSSGSDAAVGDSTVPSAVNGLGDSVGTQVASDTTNFATDASFGGGLAEAGAGTGEDIGTGVALASDATEDGTEFGFDAGIDAGVDAGTDAAASSAGLAFSSISPYIAAAEAANAISGALGGPTTQTIDDAFGGLTNSAAEGAFDPNTVISQGIGDVIEGQGGQTLDTGANDLLDNGAQIIGDSIGGDVGSDIATTGSFLTDNAFGGAIGGITDVLGGDVAGGAEDALSGGISSLSAICTALKDTGQLDRSLYIHSSRHFLRYHPLAREAYYRIAIKVARYIKNNPDSYRTFLLNKLFTARAKYISGEKSICTFLATKIISLLCIFSYIFRYHKLPTLEILSVGVN